MKIWLVKFIVKIWQGASNQHMQVSKGKSRHACMRCTPSISEYKSFWRLQQVTTYEAEYVYIHPYVVVHLKC